MSWAPGNNGLLILPSARAGEHIMTAWLCVAHGWPDEAQKALNSPLPAAERPGASDRQKLAELAVSEIASVETVAQGLRVLPALAPMNTQSSIRAFCQSYLQPVVAPNSLSGTPSSHLRK
jgi:hypothetical protein